MFLLYAEDRDLIPSRTDAEARALLCAGLRRPLALRAVARRSRPSSRHDGRAARRLGAAPRRCSACVHHGDGKGKWIRGRGGRLFDPAVYPFLQGQEKPGDAPAPAPVSDGCIFRILDALITVDGEKLSYRTLDVEQIGSVYETVMGFTIETRRGSGGGDQGRQERPHAGLRRPRGACGGQGNGAGKVPQGGGRPQSAVRTRSPSRSRRRRRRRMRWTALRPIVDERGSPGGQVSPPGTPLLQPTDERRRTGSHYTPRSLTQPIVQHALEPAFERIGPDAKPEDVLALKVCDPAMGSGAFLVEACRALGDRLVDAWRRWPETRPKIPDDEDEPLHARRLVAQRCLYGVDKNPRAVELAKLSLWLATLARDHEFTFLDHALKMRRQPRRARRDADRGAALGSVEAGPAAVPQIRRRPGRSRRRRRAPKSSRRPMTRRASFSKTSTAKSRSIVDEVRALGDAVISAFFAEDKPKREGEAARDGRELGGGEPG